MNRAAVYAEEWASSSEDWSEPVESPRFTNVTENGNTFVGKTAATDGMISRLNRLYEFRGGLALEEFLQENLHQNRYMAAVLIEAHGVIRDYFGSGTRVILEVVTDPDAPADQQLFIVIRTRFPTKIARDLLSVLRKRWWRTLPRTARRKMELDVE